ncbi:cobalamin biosynthesis protein CobQ [Eubacterium sp. AB3007]|uniref:cobalamin biosynthesis protein CobQ n=1 Tax=Eubacterium sp. AB3007 TaxID=1392487 RepID=UPI0004862E0A|nr:cobalamin biosynthesis protein CobQ [Eubacterium sp. AB3007]
MSDFKIGWLFPDTLFLHGERGNLLALARFAQLAGLSPVVEKIDFSTEGFEPANYDVLFCAPGEIACFQDVVDWLTPYKDKLTGFVSGGHPLIVTGTSIGLFCHQVLRADGSEMYGLGLLRAIYGEKEDVYGDDIYFKCVYNDAEMEIIGNQIRMGNLDIGNEKPFGHLLYGYGNLGKDRTEGIIKWNSIFTNTLGPMLVCNPWLTQQIIRVAAKKKGIDDLDFHFDPKLEMDSFLTKKEFILTKETKLKNCK